MMNIKKLSKVMLLIWGTSTNSASDFAVLGMLNISTGLKRSYTQQSSTGLSEQADFLSFLKRLGSQFGSTESISNLMRDIISVDLNTLCMWNITNAFGIGVIAGIGGNVDWNHADHCDQLAFTTHAPLHGKLGLSIKLSSWVHSFGVRSGYRYTSLESGKTVSHTKQGLMFMAEPKLEYDSVATGTMGWGYFYHGMFLIPIGEAWKVILSFEIWDDSKPTEVKASNDSHQATWRNFHTGGRVGFGVGYSLLGEA